jgi:TonB family protein
MRAASVALVIAWWLGCGDRVTGVGYPGYPPPSSLPPGASRPGYPVGEIEIHGPDAGHETGCYGDPSCRGAPGPLDAGGPELNAAEAAADGVEAASFSRPNADGSARKLDLVEGGAAVPHPAAPDARRGFGDDRVGLPMAPVPHGEASFGVLSMSVPIPDASETVRLQIVPGARRCYQRGLEYDPAQAGDITVAVQVDPNGAVQSATTSSSHGVQQVVLRCVLQVIRRAKFTAPGPAGSTIRIPLQFTKETP